MLENLKQKLGLQPDEREDDVADDPALAQSRDAGGLGEGSGDAGSTTGTGDSGEFVGRVSGQDDGAERLTGAEARAFGADSDTDTPSHSDPDS